MGTGSEVEAASHVSERRAPYRALISGARDAALWVELALVILLVVLAWRLQWIADDGYIYLTHVQNWVENGNGPNLNAGERVEGYTSVAWLVVLAVGDLFRPDRWLDLEQLTVLVGLAFTTAAAATWIAVERTAIRTTTGSSTSTVSTTSAASTASTVSTMSVDIDRRVVVVNVPLALFASSYVVRSYATSGLETPLIMCWLVAVVWVVWQRPRRPLAVAALAGVGPLVRPDLALVSLGLVGLVALDWWRARRGATPFGARRSAGLVALVVVPGLLSEVVRIAYYGQLLPNTYYAKTGTPHGWSDGWRYVRDAAGPHRWWWVAAMALAVAAVPVLTRWRYEHRLWFAAADRRRLWLLGFAFVTAASAMSVGGDFMHGRTLIPSFLLVLGSLSGASSIGLAHLRVRRPWASIAAVGSVLAVVLVQLPTTSRQHSTGELIIDGIADELRFYERRNPNIHEFGADNLDPLAARGRDLAALAERLDTEIGAAFGPIGMTSYYAQRGGGDVFIYDVHGLTRPDVARVEPAPTGTRVGHSRRATEPMVAADARVDFSELSLAGYDDAFRLSIGSSEFVLIGLDLIEPLHAAGIITDVDVTRMRGYIDASFADTRVDPDLATLLTWRYPTPDPDAREDPNDVARRPADWDDLVRTSPWSRWMSDNAAELSLLDADDCGGFGSCLRQAIDAHRADPIPFLPPGALAPPG